MPEEKIKMGKPIELETDATEQKARSQKARKKKKTASGTEDHETSTIFYIHAVSMFGGRVLSGMLNFYNSFFSLSRNDKAKIHRNIGHYYMKKGLYQKAIPSLKQWAQMDVSNPDAQFQFALALAKAGKTNSAVIVLKRVLKIDPHHTVALLIRCKLQLKSKEYDKAVEGLLTLLELDPENAEILFLLGTTYNRQEKVDEAIDSLKQATELAPYKAKYFQHLGLLYERMGKSDEAAKCFSKVMELEDEEEDVEI